MKLNKLFMVLAATAIVGCTSDDLGDFSATQAPEEDSRLVQLDPNFVIAGVGVDANATRTHWEWEGTAGKSPLVNKFLPIYTAGATFTATLDADADLTAQAVGLCWLGQTPNENVYTNYQFYHFGWLNNGETEANVECGQLMNGAMYDEITMTTGTVSAEAKPGTDWTVGGLPPKAVKGGKDNLNYNSGVYKTDNKAIFGGQYIVYYPFNEDFKDAGTIPAKAETTFNPVSQSFDTPEIGKATFRYSAPVTIEGGAQAGGFGLYNLSSLVQLRVACPASDKAIGKTIDQIVLCSASGKLLKQANLAADKIVAGQKGAGLYASTEGTKTIVANFGAAVTLDKTDGTVKSAYITVLPTTVSDLKVLVHRTDGKWATIDKANTEFEAGKAKRLDVTVKDDDFKADFIAVDYTSLVKAIGEADAVATAAKPATVTVIGDITLAGDPNIGTWAYPNSKYINITGDDIIVPENISLSVETNMQSDVRVLGKSCCTGTLGGRLNIYGGTLNNVTMEPTEVKNVTPANYQTLNPMVTYYGSATIAAGKTFDVQAGTVEVWSAVQHKGDINIAEGVTLNVNAGGDLNFMGSKVVNDGTIEVKKAGKFDMTDANGDATATDGQRMTNNGTFIHNVDAGVGTAVQSMKQNGEYRCCVDDQIKLDDAFLQWKASSVIEMVNTVNKNYNLGNACQHNNKYVDIEVNSKTATTTFDNPKPDDKKIQIGNLTVTSGALVVDFVKVGTTTGKRELEVNGDMVAKANTTFTDSKKITITKNLTVDGAGVTLTYAGSKANEGGLAVTNDITVSGAAADFDASATNALDITCANFYLKAGAQAEFGNRTEGDAQNLVVSGTISNPAGCYFNILPAGTNVLAWVTCKKLEVGGTWNAARPRVE